MFENTGDPSPSTSQVLPSTGSKGVFALWQGQMYLMCKASHPSRSLASGTHNLNAVPPPRRSASRIGESDGKVNRKRIKAIRVELQKKGWKSIGY